MKESSMSNEQKEADSVQGLSDVQSKHLKESLSAVQIIKNVIKTRMEMR